MVLIPPSSSSRVGPSCCWSDLPVTGLRRERPKWAFRPAAPESGAWLRSDVCDVATGCQLVSSSWRSLSRRTNTVIASRRVTACCVVDRLRRPQRFVKKGRGCGSRRAARPRSHDGHVRLDEHGRDVRAATCPSMGTGCYERSVNIDETSQAAQAHLRFALLPSALLYVARISSSSAWPLIGVMSWRSEMEGTTQADLGPAHAVRGDR